MRGGGWGGGGGVVVDVPVVASKCMYEEQKSKNIISTLEVLEGMQHEKQSLK